MPKRKTLNFKFEPLGTCPKDMKKRWQKKANRAHTSFKAAIELKCLECTAWDRKEAVNCFVTSCPLHAFNRSIFGGGTNEEQPTETT